MPSIRSVLLSAAALAGAASLSACGFTPMYADNSLTQSLAGVQVEAPPHSRTGYLVAQAIDDELGRNRGVPPRYRVRLDLRETRAPRGVRVNNVAGRYEIDLTTTYTLIDAETGTPLTTGAFVTPVSYDSADAPYAGLAASQEGEERAAQQAAVRLRLELSRYINGHPYHAAATAAGATQSYSSKAGPLNPGPDVENPEAPRDDLTQTQPGSGAPTTTRDPI